MHKGLSKLRAFVQEAKISLANRKDKPQLSVAHGGYGFSCANGSISSPSHHHGYHKFTRRELAQVHGALSHLTVARVELGKALAALEGFGAFNAQALRNAERYVHGSEYMLDEMLALDERVSGKRGA